MACAITFLASVTDLIHVLTTLTEKLSSILSNIS